MQYVRPPRPPTLRTQFRARKTLNLGDGHATPKFIDKRTSTSRNMIASTRPNNKRCR